MALAWSSKKNTRSRVELLEKRNLLYTQNYSQSIAIAGKIKKKGIFYKSVAWELGFVSTRNVAGPCSRSTIKTYLDKGRLTGRRCIGSKFHKSWCRQQQQKQWMRAVLLQSHKSGRRTDSLRVSTLFLKQVAATPLIRPWSTTIANIIHTAALVYYICSRLVFLAFLYYFKTRVRWFSWLLAASPSTRVRP